LISKMGQNCCAKPMQSPLYRLVEPCHHIEEAHESDLL
jgi:hypothetical protein